MKKLLSSAIRGFMMFCMVVKTVGNCKFVRMSTIKQYRVFYVVKLGESIYILHAFIKKTQKTLQHDIGVGMQRYKAAINCFRGIKK